MAQINCCSTCETCSYVKVCNYITNFKTINETLRNHLNITDPKNEGVTISVSCNYYLPMRTTLLRQNDYVK